MLFKGSKSSVIPSTLHEFESWLLTLLLEENVGGRRTATTVELTERGLLHFYWSLICVEPSLIAMCPAETREREKEKRTTEEHGEYGACEAAFYAATAILVKKKNY